MNYTCPLCGDPLAPSSTGYLECPFDGTVYSVKWLRKNPEGYGGIDETWAVLFILGAVGVGCTALGGLLSGAMEPAPAAVILLGAIVVTCALVVALSNVRHR